MFLQDATSESSLCFFFANEYKVTVYQRRRFINEKRKKGKA